MSKLTYKVSYYVLYAMFAVILVVLGLFYFGGDATGADALNVDAEMWQPANTNALLFLIYGLLAVAIIATLLGAIFQFGAAFKDSPAAAIKSLLGLILLVAVLVISWALGSDQQLVIPGYDGTDNVPFWLKLTDMFLFSIYFLLGFAIVAIIASSIWKKLS